MSIREIALNCDGSGCRAWCRTELPKIEQVRQWITYNWGWTHRDGQDFCGRCSGDPDC